MNTNEIEAKLEKDNLTIKTQIENLQNTIKKLKQDMFNANDSKINLSTSNVNSSNISITSLSNTIKEPQNNNNNNKIDADNKNLGMKFSFNSYMFEQNQPIKNEMDKIYDSKAFNEKLEMMIQKNNTENNNIYFNNNVINFKEENYDNENKMNFIRSRCFYNENNNINQEENKIEENKYN